MIQTSLNLCFPDETTALAVAAAIVGMDPADVTSFPPDGWVVETPTGPHYYNIDPVGAVVETPAVLDADMNVVTPAVMRPGYHILGLWRGEPETVPDALKAFLVTYDIGRVWG